MAQILSKQPEKIIFAGNIKFNLANDSQFVDVTATGARLNNVKRKEFTINTADIPTDTEAAPAQMTYDENGNMLTLTKNGQATTYEYDFRDMLTKITGPDYLREYEYSAAGIRLKAIEDGNKRYFIQLEPGDNAIELKKEGEKFKIVKIRGIGEFDFEQKKNYYFHRNHRGDMVNVTDQNGDSVAKFTYKAFGKTTAEGTLKDKFRVRFSGKEWDEKSKLYYYGYRYYNPKLKRWQKADPAGSSDNLYIFCDNNPVNSIDLLGLDNYLNDNMDAEITEKLENNWDVASQETITHDELKRETFRAYMEKEAYLIPKGNVEYIKTSISKTGYTNLDSRFHDNQSKVYKYELVKPVRVEEGGNIINTPNIKLSVEGRELNYHLMGHTTADREVSGIVGEFGVFVHKLKYLSWKPSSWSPSENTHTFYRMGRIDGTFMGY